MLDEKLSCNGSLNVTIKQKVIMPDPSLSPQQKFRCPAGGHSRESVSTLWPTVCNQDLRCGPQLRTKIEHLRVFQVIFEMALKPAPGTRLGLKILKPEGCTTVSLSC
jgi:hypothetical protein